MEARSKRAAKWKTKSNRIFIIRVFQNSLFDSTRSSGAVCQEIRQTSSLRADPGTRALTGESTEYKVSRCDHRRVLANGYRWFSLDTEEKWRGNRKDRFAGILPGILDPSSRFVLRRWLVRYCGTRHAEVMKICPYSYPIVPANDTHAVVLKCPFHRSET